MGHLLFEPSTSAELLSSSINFNTWYLLEKQTSSVEKLSLTALETESLSIEASDDGEWQYCFCISESLNHGIILKLMDMLTEYEVQQALMVSWYSHQDATPAVVLKFKLNQASHVEAIRCHLAELRNVLNTELSIVNQLPELDQPGLLVMDMDSTAIEIECIDKIARLADVYEEVSAVTASAMAGNIGFQESLKLRVAKLKGIENSLIESFKNQLPYMPGVETLCNVLKQHNWKLAIASGGFVPFAEVVQKKLNLDHIHANQLEQEDGQLTGQVLGTIVDAEEKARYLESLTAQYSLPKQQTVAIGDGANDLKMMAAAGLGVAIHGKPKVVAEADAAICQGGLDQLLAFLTVPKFK